MKEFALKSGKIIVYAGNSVSVDDIIAFLEQHRGKAFHNGAAADLAFCVDPKKNTVSCDEVEFFLENYVEDAEEEDAAVAYLYS